MSVNPFERKDRRGGGYAKRKFTLEEAQAIRKEYKGGGHQPKPTRKKVQCFSANYKYVVERENLHQMIIVVWPS